MNKSEYVWKHNGMRGQVKLIETVSHTITQSPSATPKAKDIARKIRSLSNDLHNELKIRLDPK